MSDRYFIDDNGEYIELMYDGPTPSGSTPVPRREAEWFDLVDGAWVINQNRRDDAAAKTIRGLRDKKLRIVDKIVSNPLRWSDLTSDKQSEWSQYRVDLLNVPQQSGFPNSILWPTEPN
tara:strand:+ start:2155 stop:2511 length:357 start_codon:yes stop_codon:yes gene_type:complete